MKDRPSAALLAAASVAIGAFLVHELYDLDVWWHVRIGEDILASRALPAVDRYAAAALGRPYHDPHWLFQVLLALAYRAAGFLGVEVLTISLWAVALFSCYRATRRWASGEASAILLFLAAMASVERFLPRPEVVSFVMIAMFYRRLQEERWRSPRELAILGALQAVWTNSHGLFVLGPFLAGCYWVVEAARRLRGRSTELPALTRLMGVLLVCTLCTPYGLGAWRYAFLLVTEAGTTAGLPPLGELSPTFGLAARSAPAFWFYLLLVVGTGLTGALVLRQGLVSARLLIALGMCAASLSGRRNVVLFALVAAPHLAENLRTLARVPLRLPSALIVAVTVAMLGWTWLPLSGTYDVMMEVPARFGFGVTPSFFPHALPAFLDRVGFRGQVLNSNTLGGFYLYHGFPRRIPLADGRWEVYDPHVLAWIRDAPRDHERWQRLVSTFDIRGILLQHASPEARALLPALPGDGGWRLVYFDNAASFWMRVDAPGLPPPAEGALPPGPARIDDCLMLDLFLRDVRAPELRLRNLERALSLGWRTEVLLERIGSVEIELGRTVDAERTFERLLRKRPHNVTALNELAFLAFGRGDLRRAESLLQRALDADPGNADIRANYARVLEALRDSLPRP